MQSLDLPIGSHLACGLPQGSTQRLEESELSCRVGPGPSCLSSRQRRSLVPTQDKISEKAELCLATFCWVVLSTGICCLERCLFIF